MSSVAVNEFSPSNANLTPRRNSPYDSQVILRDVVRVMVDVMTPYIGAHMASVAVETHAQKLGLTESISDEKLEELLNRLETGLSVFTGRDKATKIVLEMRQKLPRAGGGS